MFSFDLAFPLPGISPKCRSVNDQESGRQHFCKNKAVETAKCVSFRAKVSAFCSITQKLCAAFKKNARNQKQEKQEDTGSTQEARRGITANA